MDTIVICQDNGHFEILNCFNKDDENLDTLDKDELAERPNKSFDIKVEKVRKIQRRILNRRIW